MKSFLVALAAFSFCACATQRAGGDGSPARNVQFRYNGSLGAEKQWTPKSTSPLLPAGAQLTRRTNVADANLSAEASPEDSEWKAKLKLRSDASDAGAEHLELAEASLRFDVTKWLDVSAGRIIEKWGTAYAWNPTAFVSPRKNPVDPDDRRSTWRGVDMIRTNAVIGDTTFSLYAMNHDRYAARAYRLIGGTDVALQVERDRGVTRQGVSVARVFGNALELHGELARRRAVVGGQYTFAGGANIMLELYRSGDGMNETEWRRFREAVDRAQNEEAFVQLNREFRPLQMARAYAFVRLDVPIERADTDIEIFAIPSLRDGSSLVRFGLTRKLRQNVSLYVLDTEFVGGEGSEFSYVQVERTTVAGCRYHF